MKNQPDKFYVTTAIPYVNARPHMGHALEYIQTDVIARFHRLLGEQVFFLTGADENSLKNVQAAEAEGIPTAQLVDRNTQIFVDLLQALDISNNHFIRTVEPRHFAGVQKLWSACRPEDIYKKSYQGLYCVGCEAFYSPNDLVDGKCPEHQVAPDVVEEENYFFRLSAYQARLEELIASDAFQVVPESRKNEVLGFIRGGLQDFSISRSQERARGWGVPVPNDPAQVIYVWYDALGNYITGLDYANDDADAPDSTFRKWWPCDVHCIGKGIIRFHAVYWPAMLLSAGLPLPRSLFVHGYITLDGQKMSKSLGAVIDPFEHVARYGVEVLRYYMIRHISPTQDGDYNTAKLEEAYTADLANGVGNLLSRSLTMIAKSGGGRIKRTETDGAAEREIHLGLTRVCEDFEALMRNFEFSQAYARVWEGVASLDKFINDRQPWAMAKDASRRAELESVLYTLAEGLRMIGSLIYPVMPRTAAEIWRRLGLHQQILEVPWADHRRWGFLADGLQVDKGDPLFPRFEK